MLRTSAKDAASVVSRLREFYRPADTDEEFPIVDLAKVVQQSVALTEPKWRALTQARGISVAVGTEFKAFPMVAGEESALREVLTNLLFNAVDAMPEGGRISIETSIENETAVIRVTDTGTGMTESVRQRCLSRFSPLRRSVPGLDSVCPRFMALSSRPGASSSSAASPAREPALRSICRATKQRMVR